jgi:hypothetical protein
LRVTCWTDSFVQANGLQSSHQALVKRSMAPRKSRGVVKLPLRSTRSVRVLNQISI